MSEKLTTFAEYMNDETRVSKDEKERVELLSSIICTLIEAREEKGLTQRELAKLCGLKQPALARVESMKSLPQLDTILKILNPLGYTLSIVPVKERKKIIK